MGIWLVTQKLILLEGLSLKGITRRRRGQVAVHKFFWWGKANAWYGKVACMETSV